MAKLPTYLFAGIPGINKSAILKSFRRELMITQGLLPDDIYNNSEDIDSYGSVIIPIIEFPAYNVSYNDAKLAQLRSRIKNHTEIFERKLQEASSDNNIKYLIIHSHLSYYLNGVFQSWLSLHSSLRLLKKYCDLKHVITLVENVFYTRDEVSEHNIPIRDIVIWRDIELMLADAVSQIMSDSNIINSDLISVHQSMNTLNNILFNSNSSKIYMAFPITEVRRREKDPERTEQVQQIFAQNRKFREHLSNKFVAFDPSSIDEVLYRFYSKRFQRNNHTKDTIIEPDNLWPLSCDPEQTILGSSRIRIQVPTTELQEFVSATHIISEFLEGGTQEVKSMALRGIRARDFRLIDQSDAVAIFRPTLKGKWSNGVLEEFHYAATHGMLVCLLVDKADGDWRPNVVAALGDEYSGVKVFSGNLDDEEQFSNLLEQVSSWLEDQLGNKIEFT